MTATFKIVRGVTTNRVRRGSPSRSKAFLERFDPSVQRAVAKFRASPDHPVGVPYTSICISLPVADLIAMDELADHVGMNRSQLIREAVRELRKTRGL